MIRIAVPRSYVYNATQGILFVVARQNFRDPGPNSTARIWECARDGPSARAA
jgi:hypothetical protein